MISKEEFNKIGYDIIHCAFNVHTVAGRGMRENYYHHALEWELRQMGYEVRHKVVVPALYKGIEIKDAYECDILVNNTVVIEVKATSLMREGECRQLMTYMKLMTRKLGYLINFGAKDFCIGSTKEPLPFEKGIYRFVNRL